MSFTGESKTSSKTSSSPERFFHSREFQDMKTQSPLFSRSRCSVAPSQAYHDPMLKLSIMTEEELAHIFGDLDAYIPLHEGMCASYSPTLASFCCSSHAASLFLAELLVKLSEGTGTDGTVAQIGQIVIDWVRPEGLLVYP